MVAFVERSNSGKNSAKRTALWFVSVRDRVLVFICWWLLVACRSRLILSCCRFGIAMEISQIDHQDEPCLGYFRFDGKIKSKGIGIGQEIAAFSD